MRAAVDPANIRYEASPIDAISVSVGYRHAGALDSATPAQLMEEADKTPYAAKTRGRHRVARHVGGTIAATA